MNEEVEAGRQGSSHGGAPAGGVSVTDASKFEAFFRGAPDMMAILGVDARLETVNPAFVAVSGYGEDALRGRCLLDFLVAEELFTGFLDECEQAHVSLLLVAIKSRRMNVTADGRINRALTILRIPLPAAPCAAKLLDNRAP